VDTAKDVEENKMLFGRKKNCGLQSIMDHFAGVGSTPKQAYGILSISQGSHSFTDKKSMTSPGLSRTPTKNFPGPYHSPRMFKFNILGPQVLK